MIKLFSSTDKVFTSNGDVVLNPTKAIVHKEDNGDYYLDIEMGLEYVDYIVEGNIIVAPTPTGDQAFRIGNVTKKKSKISTRCYHVFYDSENYLIVDSYVVNKTCAEALSHLNNATEPVSEFTTSSDVSHVDSFRCVRKSLYEAVQTVLERWGGHLVRDNFGIQIKSSIGHDNGIIVQYKKNLKDITCSENWNNVVTKILPVGRDGIMLNELDPTADIYITSSTQYDLPYTKTVSFNQTLNEEDYPSEQAFKEALVADLRAQATSYLATNCVPQVNYTLKANLEKLTDVGDVVEVIDERLGVHLMTSVIAFDYDCIFGKYTDIQFGNFPQTIAGLANRIATTTENYINGKGYTATSWNQIQSTGTKIAEVVIDGRTYDVYAPAGGSSDVSWNQTQGSGDKIAEVTIDGTTQNVYAPNSQTFSEASTRANIDSGETYPTIFGKIKKFFADLKAVAFSGLYSDLSGKPTKLSDFTNDVVNNATLTIQKNGTNVQTFTANASSNATANITVPTKTSDLTNDSGYVTSTDLNGKVSKTGDTMTGDLELQGADIILDATNSGGNILQRQTSDPSYVYTNALPAQDGTLATTSDVNGKVSKTGDIMTGDLVLKGTTSDTTDLMITIDHSGVASGNIIQPQTAVSNALAVVTLPSDSGTLALTSQIPTNNNQLTNGAGYITSAGSCAYATSAGTATDNTKVAKTGDTMTGNLNLQGTPSNITELWMSVNNSGMLYGNILEPQSSVTTALAINTLPSSSGTLALTSQIPTNNNQLTNGAGYITSAGSCNYANSAGTATDNTKVAKTGDTMTGSLEIKGADLILDASNGSGNMIERQTSDQSYCYTNTLPAKDGTFAMTNDFKTSSIQITKGQAIEISNILVPPNGSAIEFTIPTNTNELTNGAGFISNTLPIMRVDTDIPEGATNLSNTATAHRVTAYRNGFSIPYQMDDTNDGGIIRVRGTSESNCILELGTWDDSGAGETIQFNYYPTTSQVTPTHSVTVPKKSGTIALLDDVNAKVSKSGDSMSGVLSSSYKSSSWLNSWYSSAISLDDSVGSFGGWICGPTLNGRIAIQTYQASDDKLYIGYATRGRTTNSNERQVCWNGATGKWECDITGTAEQANKDGSGNTITSTYLKKGGDTITGNLVIGNGGGYLNAGASNGGCNSILVGDDAWLGDVNQGGTVGVKSANSYDAGFAFYGIDGSSYGYLKSDSSWLHTNRSFLLEGLNALYFGDGSIFLVKDSNSWLHIKSNNGNIYRATYHDFKNPDNTAWVTISALSFATQSSKRYKENIVPISEEKAIKILDVDVVNFDYKKDSGHGEGDERLDKTGVIAEDVVDIIPEVVSYREIDGEQKVDSVDYAKFVPFLIKMVQIQQKEIDELKELIKAKGE